MHRLDETTALQKKEDDDGGGQVCFWISDMIPVSDGVGGLVSTWLGYSQLPFSGSSLG
jgi:hypothetical protein